MRSNENENEDMDEEELYPETSAQSETSSVEHSKASDATSDHEGVKSAEVTYGQAHEFEAFTCFADAKDAVALVEANIQPKDEACEVPRSQQRKS